MDLLGALSNFVRVVETGSFSRTAREVGLSQTVVTRQIAHLEQHFGVRLLHRTTRQLNLTDDGQILVGHARRLLEQSSEMERELGVHRNMPAGLVRLGSIMGAGLFLTSRLPELLRRYPELSVQLTVCDQLGDMVRSRLDLALYPGDVADSSFITRHIASLECAIVAAPTYVERHGQPQTPADLEHHACIQQEGENRGGAWDFQGPDGPVSVGVSGQVFTSNERAALIIARNGGGVACLPYAQIRDDLCGGRLVRLLGPYRPKPLMLHVIYPTKRLLAPRTRAVLEFLVEQARADHNKLDFRSTTPCRARGGAHIMLTPRATPEGGVMHFA